MRCLRPLGLAALAALLVTAGAAGGGAYAQTEREALIETFATVSPSVGALYALESDGDLKFLCTATAVDRHRGQTVILTAYHCLERGVSYLINFGDNNLRPVTAWKIPHYEVNADAYPRAYGEPETDMALFLMEGADVPVAPLAADSGHLVYGAKLAIVGYPLGVSKIVYEGIVAGRFERPGNDMDNYILMQIFGAPGSSGSSVVDVETGEVVGVLVAARQAMTGLPVIFATPIDYRRYLLEVHAEVRDAGPAGGSGEGDSEDGDGSGDD